LGLRSPSEYDQKSSGRLTPDLVERRNGSSHEVSSPSAYLRTRQRLIVPELSCPSHQRPQVLSTSRRLTALSLSALFHAESALGVCPPELCSSGVAVRRLRRLIPSCRSEPSLPGHPEGPERPTKQPVQPGPRLQGLAPHWSPPPPNNGLGCPGHVALLGFSPPGFKPTARWFDFHRASPHKVAAVRVGTFTHGPLQGIAPAEDERSLSRPSTLLGFGTS